MSANLPPLPRVSECSVDAAFWGGERLFTAQQMRDYALLAMADSFERAARLMNETGQGEHGFVQPHAKPGNDTAPDGAGA
jgi:hypothetical protein